MNNPAINTINPAAACPDWCITSSEAEHLLTWPSGEWDVTHESARVSFTTGEDVAPGVAVDISVGSDAFVCNYPSKCRDRSLWVMTEDSDGRRECLTMTARQALRLAGVLAQEAAAVLATEATTTLPEVAR